VLADQPIVPLGAAVALVAAIVATVLVDETDVRVGLFGLVGTLVGALATFEGTQRKSRQDRLARKRSAGRLLQEDLLFARTRCHNALNNKRFWAPRLDLRLDGWERYRETVSEELADTAEWQDVARAFEAMRAVQSKCNGLRSSFGDRPGLGRLSGDVIAEYLKRSDAAVDALRRLSGDRPTDETAVPDDGA